MQEVETKIEVRLNNTEDPQKVVQAVSNIACCEEPTFLEQEYGKLMFFHGSGKESLSPLKRLLFERKILSAARKMIRSGQSGNVFRFCLNKQAAYSAQVSFCEEVGESPLGPLVVEVTAIDPEAFLDWLAPRAMGDETSDDSCR